MDSDGTNKIRHSERRLGDPIPTTDPESTPAKVSEPSEPGIPEKKEIRAFEQRFGKRHEEKWSRTPNTTGQGAIHVRTFHCKLTADAIVYLDQTINEWLDAHPQYEVKFVSSTIGIMSGKLREENLFCQVWV